jgi:hypothetical protein
MSSGLRALLGSIGADDGSSSPFDEKKVRQALSGFSEEPKLGFVKGDHVYVSSSSYKYPEGIFIRYLSSEERSLNSGIGSNKAIRFEDCFYAVDVNNDGSLVIFSIASRLLSKDKPMWLVKKEEAAAAEKAAE